MFGDKKTDIVIKKGNTSLALADMEADAGGGYEDVDNDSRTRPHLVICQSKTPVVEKGNPNYIEGGEPGMFFNTVTEEFIPGDEGVFVVPCAFSHVFSEKDKAGNYLGRLEPTDPRTFRTNTHWGTDDEGKKCLLTAEDTVLIELAYHFVLASRTGDDFQPVIMTFKSTQLQRSNNWNSAMENRRYDGTNGKFQPAKWWQMYKFTLGVDTNKKGNSYGYRFTFVGQPDPSVAAFGKEFRKQVTGGGINVNPTSSDDDEIAPF